MDTRPDMDQPKTDEPTTAIRRFDALADELGATYPLLAPAAAVAIGEEEDAFDAQILAGLVNV